MTSTHDMMSPLFPYAETTLDVTVRVAVTYFADQSDPDLGKWF